MPDYTHCLRPTFTENEVRDIFSNIIRVLGVVLYDIYSLIRDIFKQFAGRKK
jgi:hypothetical protein